VSDGAITTYETIYQLSPDSVSAMETYVALLKGANEFPEARTVLEAALACGPQKDRAKAELIRVDAEIDGLEAGLARARGFAIEDLANPLYNVVSAEFYENAGRPDDALELLKKAVVARPSAGADWCSRPCMPACASPARRWRY
jgi:predicted Zn-dependent protease